MGVAANCGGASPTGTLRLSSCNGLLMSHSPLTSARPTADRALVHESAGGARWDVDLHRPVHRDTRIGEQFDGTIFVRDITPIHWTENALRTTAARVGGF
jgi:hypothetical protein